MKNAPKTKPSPSAAPEPVKITWTLTEENAQKLINLFEWSVRNGGLAISKEVQPLANDLMQTALTAQQAREAAAKAAETPKA
jgi:hypothetical protein